jgi:Zn-dependent M28 family amino/carboxypeptidase
MLEIARSLAAGQRPRRSVLFISHAAEERGLLGSRWFTDHPTVPRDSMVGEIDMDMIGRGGASDLPAGGPEYLEVIGARRLSREFGDVLEEVNARQARPFRFDYTYDAPGHPLQYYCRADHYSYARWGIPAVALSRGEHLDYHQVTDEPQYIDYDGLARVATLVRDAALELANRAERPRLSSPRPDPTAPCRQ